MTEEGHMFSWSADYRGKELDQKKMIAPRLFSVC